MSAPALKLQATPLRQVDSVKGLLMNQQARDQLAAVAARHMNPERMMRVVANAIRTTPKLGQCEPMSFLGALMQCASLGLEPNTILGHAYMIPFENRKKGVTEVQVVVGYKGLIDLARRSGHISSLSANIHYSDDELWEYEEGTEARLRHRPGMLKGEKLHAYAIAKFTDGGHAYVVLPWAHIISIRDASQGWQTAKRFGKTADSPWGKHEDEMAKKTAIRALAKYLPLSVEFMDAMQVDDARADYRAFAMDPTQGVTVEEDGETIEGEAEPEAVQQQLSDERATQRPVEQARAKAPAQQRKRTDETPYTEMADRPAAERAADPEPVADDASPFQSIVDRIAGDLLDGAKPEELLAGFAPEIAAMKAQAPGIYENLKNEIAGYAPDLIGTF
ncbi:recombinase RecT [Pseudogemmobacter faecipullorum]|uniref:Recombinase RecT n=1 Tax=Pseudogemmobacter faecipullorum TaxID=2755041 RepID=A0ABS8CR26_9RHOB|nr:recombinase RecT [Pseudogemmobacter faecipullorum]MCB5411818.1 recombinase RecT [Pseudogemmobacter faecipullorum]